MNYLYSLYDALVSISVPSDKARAVVDAMERDMGTTLATKQDLEILTLATKQDVVILRRKMEGGFEALRREMENRLEALKREMENRFEVLKRDLDGRFALVDQRFESLELRLTVKLGSMMVVGFALTIAALRLWS